MHYIYIYIYTYIHTRTYIYIYQYISQISTHKFPQTTLKCPKRALDSCQSVLDMLRRTLCDQYPSSSTHNI